MLRTELFSRLEITVFVSAPKIIGKVMENKSWKFTGKKV